MTWSRATRRSATSRATRSTPRIPSPAAGRIAELLIEVGTTVDAGTVIATMEEESALRAPSPGAVAAGGEGEAAAPASGRGGADRHSPVVVRLAAELGVALETVLGSGRGGRVRREDVLAAAKAAETTLDALRRPGGSRACARRSVSTSKCTLREAATVTSWIEVDFSRRRGAPACACRKLASPDAFRQARDLDWPGC